MGYKAVVLLMLIHFFLCHGFNDCSESELPCSLKETLNEHYQKIIKLESSLKTISNDKTVKGEFKTLMSLEKHVNNTAQEFLLHLNHVQMVANNYSLGIRKSLETAKKEILTLTSQDKEFESIINKFREQLNHQWSNSSQILRKINLNEGSLKNLRNEFEPLQMKVGELYNDSLGVGELLGQLLEQNKSCYYQIYMLQDHLLEMEAVINVTKDELFRKVETINTEVEELKRSQDDIKQLHEEVSYIKQQLEESSILTKMTPEPEPGASDRILSEIRELKEKCVTKAELEQQIQAFCNNSQTTGSVNSVSSKCSINVHHEPKSGNIKLRMAMSPPCSEDASCP